MSWVLFAAPVVVFVIFLLTGRPDRRRGVELDRWRKKAGNPRKVTSIPGLLARILEPAGGGTPVAYFELVPKIAYLAAMGADAFHGSEHATVVGRLDDQAPTFCVRPLPVLEGERVANTGVEFKKDDEFMGLFLVERTLDGEPSDKISETADKAIRKWLSPPLREALLDLPDAWLRVDGKNRTMAMSVYGLFDAEKMEALVATADIVFAEYGADGGPSLLAEGDGEEEDEEDERDADEQDEEDEDDEEDDVLAKPKAAAKPVTKPVTMPAAKPGAKAAAKPVAKSSPAKR
jgi:hypothetical protein